MAKHRSPSKAEAKATPKPSRPAPVRRRWIGARALLRERPGTVVGVVLAVHLLLGLLAFEPALNASGDNAAYLALAKSLLSGLGYRELYDPAQPLHAEYPPVFPAMLAVLMALGFRPWVPFKLLVLACSCAAIALSYFWMRRKLHPELALTVAFLVAVSPGVVGLSHRELSDVPAWAFTMAALLAWERLDPCNTRRLVAASVLILVTYFTRSAGLPAILAALAWLVWRKRWKQLAILCAIIAPFVFLWMHRARSLGVDYVQAFWFVDPYSPELGRVDALGLLKRAFHNGENYSSIHLPVLLVGTDRRVAYGLAIAVIGAGIIGWARRLRHAQVAELFLPLYIGLLFVWPAVWSSERLLLPALPLILFYAGDALLRILRPLNRRRLRALSYAAALLIIGIGVPSQVRAIKWGRMCTREYALGDRYACHSAEWRDFFHIAEVSGRILPEHSAVLSRKPTIFWAVSNGIPGRYYPLSPEADSLFNAAREAGARYVVLDRLDRLSRVYLIPAILRRPGGFCVLYTLGPARTTILGIKPGAEAMPDRRPDAQAPPQFGFELCGLDFWRSKEAMEAVQGRR